MISIALNDSIGPTQLEELEWLETFGTGGWASGTLSGAATRRYHGLLVAALTPPANRWLLLAKLDETICVGSMELDVVIDTTICVCSINSVVDDRIWLDPFVVSLLLLSSW